MSAIAHGWKPPAGSKVAAIPKKVAEDFHKADQAKSVPAPKAKAKSNPIHRLGAYAHPKKK